MKKQTPETILTHSIRNLLKTFNVWHWKNFGGPMGQKGVSDLLGCYQGKMLAIEIKTPTGKVSEWQEAFLKNVRDNGGIAFVARSLDDVIENLGLQKRLLF